MSEWGWGAEKDSITLLKKRPGGTGRQELSRRERTMVRGARGCFEDQFSSVAQSCPTLRPHESRQVLIGVCNTDLALAPRLLKLKPRGTQAHSLRALAGLLRYFLR